MTNNAVLPLSSRRATAAPGGARGRVASLAGALHEPPADHAYGCECHAPFSLVLRVRAVQHELVAVGNREDRHAAGAGVERVADDLHAVGLECRAHTGGVVAAQWPRGRRIAR